MKKMILAAAIIGSSALSAQSNANDLLAAGVEDAEKFMTDYLSPVSEASIYSISSGWFNSASAKPLGGFEISVIGNLTGFKNKEDKKSFILDTSEYENLQFQDRSISKEVSTALGDIEGIGVFVEAEVAPGITAREDFELPSGLSSEGIDFIPSGYLQGSVGLIKGTEIKARFLPKIETDEVSISLYGIGLQHEFTSHLPADKILPIAVSGLIGYTHLDGSYDFTNTSIIDGENQRIDASINSWNFQAIVSTRLPVINFYGALGYLSGTSTTDVLGTYRVQSGPFQETYTDPFSIEKKVNGVTANLGAKLKLGFFRLNADYSLGAFNNLSLGVNFGFR
ncbi:hypothetical protein PP178_12605 [Zeaxanthinibacter sp. PT1]|uniref:DUF6588 family protein n=1 Tax=Zeaxanthinibacter TaxID=561554 RepID=UPI00234A97EA|nr:DUF6588 family protein [Zeaxanthinibacter sp. PT1]MDC6352395.1 hypothetical protein [Zeaxanthinibacter sp. PT1]